jgi:16S rRNA (cytosine967-C5)-methyltransferase
MKSIREQILDILMNSEKDESYIQLALKKALKDLELKDKNFITEVVYGTIKNRMKLDYIINRFSNTPVNKMKPLVRNNLRIAVYQIFYMDKVPVSAAINEAVKIMHNRKIKQLTGFVNAVLRKIANNQSNISFPSKEENPKEYLSIMYSIPIWIINLWLKEYGFIDTEKICIALSKKAKVTIRINRLLITKEQIVKELSEEGIIVQDGALLEESLYLKNTSDISKISSYNKGMWIVQDESAMLVAHILNPKKGERVLDMCSAPGGKTTHIAELMDNEGTLIAFDIHPHKIDLINQNAKRMHLDIIDAKIEDATKYNHSFDKWFDKILLDAPCLGLGIMKRKPDIRYSKKEEDLKAITSLQKQMINNAYKYLKPGGTLVYSTCSMTKEENEHIVLYAEKEFGMQLQDITHFLPEKLKNYAVNKGYIQILPHMADTDGFFIASLKKRENK